MPTTATVIQDPNKLTIDAVKKISPTSQTIAEYAATLKKDAPTIILRNLAAPPSLPCLEPGVVTFDFKANPRPLSDIKTAYGTRPNVQGSAVVNAIVAALGSGGYSLHISDGSYTGYSLWQLNEYMTNFDSTNLRTWIAETFDCDDFSEVLQGNVNGFFPGIPFGTIWYGPKNPPYNWGHSVNLFYCYTNNKVYLVEPQADIFYEFDKTKWSAWMVII